MPDRLKVLPLIHENSVSGLNLSKVSGDSYEIQSNENFNPVRICNDQKKS